MAHGRINRRAMDIVSLLVSFMFITILTLGIASTLGELAEILRGADDVPRTRLAAGWTTLLLFAHFMLFWQTSDLTLIEDWNFWLFLFAQTGPVLLLLSTQVMLGAQAAGDPRGRVPGTRFLVLFGAVQVWSIAASFVVGEGFSIGRVLDLLALITCVALIRVDSQSVRRAGLLLVWGAYIANGVLLYTNPTVLPAAE
jgi:hypothetical protein